MLSVQNKLISVYVTRNKHHVFLPTYLINSEFLEKQNFLGLTCLWQSFLPLEEWSNRGQFWLQCFLQIPECGQWIHIMVAYKEFAKGGPILMVLN